MFDPVACAGITLGEPRLELFALVDLHKTLMALGFRRHLPGNATLPEQAHGDAEQDIATSTPPSTESDLRERRQPSPVGQGAPRGAGGADRLVARSERPDRGAHGGPEQ